MRKILTLIASLAIVLLGFAAPAAATEDDEAPVTASASGSCTEVTIEFTNPNPDNDKWGPKPFWANIRVDGAEGTPDDYSDMEVDEGPLAGDTFGPIYEQVEIPADDTVTWSTSFKPGTEVHTVEYRVDRGPEQHYLVDWQTIEVDCLTLAEPTDPTTTDQTCAEPGTITLADDPGVSWTIDGEAVEPGTSQAAPTEHTIAASIDDGYVLDPDLHDADPVWNVEVFPSVEPCPGPTGPKGDPGEPGEDADEVEIEDETEQTSSKQTLPNTGAGRELAALAGVTLLGLGAGLITLGRRRVHQRR